VVVAGGDAFVAVYNEVAVGIVGVFGGAKKWYGKRKLAMIVAGNNYLNYFKNQVL